ncbi:hypothetical protein QO207_06940 [Pseudomonas sp. CAN2814]|uniref:hypothetical protein n=1 Tax=Pseudomonas sp. CAN1 TaxID=3046726 RepID=UPI002649BA62|nr:hypothetical protein [Pseudomonas sp. CAN1]MDN6856322.1 hypothetical protein [Pseudomonas sp. CAN1]
MHEADTRGGLGHRRELKSLPVGCISDAVEGDIARGVPGLFSVCAEFFNLLINNDLILFYERVAVFFDWSIARLMDMLGSLFIFMDKR